MLEFKIVFSTSNKTKSDCCFAENVFQTILYKLVKCLLLNCFWIVGDLITQNKQFTC